MVPSVVGGGVTISAKACECESYSIQRDERGPFHTVTVYIDEGPKADTEVEVRHDMAPGDECNVATWLENSDESEEESTAPFDITVPFEPEWAGDFYQWRPLPQV